MTLQELQDYMESFYKVHPVIGDSAIAPTGESYVTLTLGGVKPEGWYQDQPFTKSEQAAIDAFKLMFDDWRKDQNGDTLYWRICPMVQQQRDTYFLRARLVIGDEV